MTISARKMCLVSSLQNVHITDNVHVMDVDLYALYFEVSHLLFLCSSKARLLLSSILTRVIPIVSGNRFDVGAGMSLRVPTKIPQFHRSVLNKRNDKSLRCLLPRPTSIAICDHLYTPMLSQVRWFALTQRGTKVKDRERKMMESPAFQQYLTKVISAPSTLAVAAMPTVVIKAVCLLDGWL
jgi:hypothetical protein